MNECRELRIRLNALLLQRIENLAFHLFPEGRKIGHSWRLGSLDINLRTGLWGDWDGSTDRMSRNLIDLWIYATHCDFKTAITEITRWLGMPASEISSRTTEPKQQSRPDPDRRLVLPLLEKPRQPELHELSARRLIPVKALEIALRRGFLWMYNDWREKTRAWALTDSARKSAVGRRLDGQPWQSIGGKKSKTLAGSQAAWPIGIWESEDYPTIGLVEGTPDFLALIAQALAYGVADKVAPVCMAGAAMSIPEIALPRFAGKRVRIFVHNDTAGTNAAVKWSAQLCQAEAAVDFYKFDGLVRADGRPVTDLNDLCNVAQHSRERYRKEVNELLDFATEGNE